MNQNSNRRTDSAAHVGPDEIELVADYLDILRRTAPLDPTISIETAAELEHYLALAEAALRRAGAEINADALMDRTGTLQ